MKIRVEFCELVKLERNKVQCIWCEAKVKHYWEMLYQKGSKNPCSYFARICKKCFNLVWNRGYQIEKKLIDNGDTI